MTQTQFNEEEAIEAFRKSRLNLVNFRHITLINGDKEVAPAKFHYEWSDILLDGTGHFAIEGFRESAKDQYVNRAFPLYCLMFPSTKRSYIVIIRNNDTQAAKSLESIRNEALSNPVVSSRILRIIKAAANSLICECLDDDGDVITVTIEAYGKGASVRGLANADKRPDIIICNDLQDKKDSQSDTILNNDWDWFLSDVKFLGKNTRIFMIGNNLGERCIIERIFANEQKAKDNPEIESLGFTCIRVSVADPLLEVSNWPEMFSVEFIRKERKSYSDIGELAIWIKERMCLAIDDETRTFDPQHYKWYTPGLIEHIVGNAVEVFATLDPATGKTAGTCFRAIIVCARMNDGNWYILEVPFGRWGSDVLLDKMFEVVSKYGIKRFGVEKGMFKDVIEPFIYKEMTRRNVRFNIEIMEHAKIGSKLERIKMLRPRFRCGGIWFPQEAYWLQEMLSELAGVTNDEIKSLFIDLVDALAMCEQMDTSRVLGVVQGRSNNAQPRKALR